MNVHKELKEAGVELDHHETDLYAKVTQKSFEIVMLRYPFRRNVTQFQSELDGERWFDIPFAYDPEVK
jgi:hypothetical protein